MPSVDEIIDLTIRLGRRTNPAIRVAGVSFNTEALNPTQALALMSKASRPLGLPVADPMRGGADFEALIDLCLRK